MNDSGSFTWLKGDQAGSVGTGSLGKNHDLKNTEHDSHTHTTSNNKTADKTLTVGEKKTLDTGQNRPISHSHYLLPNLCQRKL